MVPVQDDWGFAWVFTLTNEHGVEDTIPIYLNVVIKKDVVRRLHGFLSWFVAIGSWTVDSKHESRRSRLFSVQKAQQAASRWDVGEIGERLPPKQNEQSYISVTTSPKKVTRPVLTCLCETAMVFHCAVWNRMGERVRLWRKMLGGGKRYCMTEKKKDRPVLRFPLHMPIRVVITQQYRLEGGGTKGGSFFAFEHCTYVAFCIWLFCTRFLSSCDLTWKKETNKNGEETPCTLDWPLLSQSRRQWEGHNAVEDVIRGMGVGQLVRWESNGTIAMGKPSIASKLSAKPSAETTLKKWFSEGIKF